MVLWIALSAIFRVLSLVHLAVRTYRQPPFVEVTAQPSPRPARLVAERALSLIGSSGTDLMCRREGLVQLERKGKGLEIRDQFWTRSELVEVSGTVCLRFKDQSKGPHTLEKMELAKLGLGLKDLSFSIDGDALHIHSVLLDAFKQLDDCGGYTLLRLATNSTSLIEIKPPKGGMTVRYLKDIVKSTKLFVRPLQTDIESEEYVFPEVSV